MSSLASAFNPTPRLPFAIIVNSNTLPVPNCSGLLTPSSTMASFKTALSTPPQTPKSQRLMGKKMLLSLGRSASLLRGSSSSSSIASTSPPPSPSPPRLSSSPSSILIRGASPVQNVTPRMLGWPTSALPPSERDTSHSLLQPRLSPSSPSPRSPARDPLPASNTFPTPPRKALSSSPRRLSNALRRPKTPCPHKIVPATVQRAQRERQYDLASFLSMDPALVLAQEASGENLFKPRPRAVQVSQEEKEENVVKRRSVGGMVWFADEGDEDWEEQERDKLCTGLERLLWGN